MATNKKTIRKVRIKKNKKKANENLNLLPIDKNSSDVKVTIKKKKKKNEQDIPVIIKKKKQKKLQNASVIIKKKKKKQKKIQNVPITIKSQENNGVNVTIKNKEQQNANVDDLKKKVDDSLNTLDSLKKKTEESLDTLNLIQKKTAESLNVLDLLNKKTGQTIDLSELLNSEEFQNAKDTKLEFIELDDDKDKPEIKEPKKTDNNGTNIGLADFLNKRNNEEFKIPEEIQAKINNDSELLDYFNNQENVNIIKKPVEEPLHTQTVNEKKPSKKKKQGETKTFKFFDAIISAIISFFTYLFYGIKFIFVSIYKYFLFPIFREIYNLFYAMYMGIAFIGHFILIEVPSTAYNKVSKFIYDTYMKIKNGIIKREKARQEDPESVKTLTQRIKDYIVNKYENIPFVKANREKKEASLIVMSINPNGNDAVRTEQKQTFKYLARNKEGKLESGYFAALSKLDVYSYLIDKGMTVYEIKTSKAINFLHGNIASSSRKMRNKDLIFWLAQLSTYIKAGIPLADAVKVLAHQDRRRKYKGVYDSIIYELTMGESFSEALKKQGGTFPPLLINMIKSAEMIGEIENTLDEMSAYYQEIEDNKRAVISALTYPAIVLVFAIGIVIFMLVYIVPKFVDVYESMNADIPRITQITLNISSYMNNNYFVIIGVVLGIIAIYVFSYKKIKLFRTLMQTLFMKIPIVGNLLIYKELSLFARTFATLNKNNVLLTDTIDILGKITGNEIYRSIMYRTINNLLKGEKISDSFKNHWAVPEVAYYMIVTGESTGELAEMLDKVGDYYNKLQKNMVNQLKVFIEPVMIILLAIIVGFILVAIVVPMFAIYETIQ